MSEKVYLIDFFDIFKTVGGVASQESYVVTYTHTQPSQFNINSTAQFFC